MSIARTIARPMARWLATPSRVMRDGMQGKVGIGKLALYGREYLVAVRPFQRGIVMHTVHHAAEMRGIDAVDDLMPWRRRSSRRR
jgi:non-homologous end joining protein Ku